MSRSGVKVYVFNAKTGACKLFESAVAAEKECGIFGVYRALKLQRPIFKQYFVLDHRPTLKESREFYKIYCDEHIDLNAEKWKTVRGIKVSNFARVKYNEKLLVPRILSDTVVVYIDGKRVSVARLVAAAFISNRELYKDECVFHRGHNHDNRANMIYVINRKEVPLNINLGTEVALMDEEKNIKNIYNSITAAAKDNFLEKSSIARAIKENRTVGGLLFRRLEEVEGW